jgi:hypothetical protein
MHNVAMWIPALFLILVVISILVYYWPLTLTGLAIWALMAYTKRAAADPKPSYPRKPLQTRPVAKPVQTRPEPKSKPQPARELPAPEYLPRWTASRRLDAGREHAQWQKKFDNAGQ